MSSPALRLTSVADPHEATWEDFAACATGGADYWYPERGEGNSRHAETAKRICADCPVRLQCLAFALDHMRDADDAGMFGIWGGTTADERQRMLQEAA